MNPPTKVICSNCGYATNEDVGADGVTTKVGRCCENLPRPYQYDSRSGTYSAPVDRAIEMLREDDNDGCNCPDCVLANIDSRLTSEELDVLWTLYEARDPSYDDCIRQLGW